MFPYATEYLRMRMRDWCLVTVLQLLSHDRPMNGIWFEQNNSYIVLIDDVALDCVPSKTVGLSDDNMTASTNEKA